MALRDYRIYVKILIWLICTGWKPNQAQRAELMNLNKAIAIFSPHAENNKYKN